MTTEPKIISVYPSDRHQRIGYVFRRFVDGDTQYRARHLVLGYVGDYDTATAARNAIIETETNHG